MFSFSLVVMRHAAGLFRTRIFLSQEIPAIKIFQNRKFPELIFSKPENFSAQNFFP